MKLGTAMVRFSIDHPKLVVGLMVAVTIVLAALAALPTLWPDAFPMLQPVKVDTDPENMLSRDEAVRVFHNDMKDLFSLHEIVVVGVVNEADERGVFTVDTLRNIHDLTEYALTLRGERIGQDDPRAGVIRADVIAPSTVDNIEQGGIGVVKFEWLMPRPPETEEAALAVRDKAQRIPFLDGTLVSENGKAIALYLPLTSKDLSHQVYTRLRAHIANFEGDEKYYITGLPVANDVFGVEMFKQMAISAPAAMLVIFLLMLLFFRKLSLIISPMVLAIVSVICTMGALVVTGNTIHIMSSMIPIFIMPIAVLDSIHILSEFFDRYQETRDRRKTIVAVVETLFVPMLYTSLTSMAGFVSLALTPIPPVQVFGIFVGLGIMLAWLLTMTFIPAYIMFIPERRLENFGMRTAEQEGARHGFVDGLLQKAGAFTYARAKLIVACAGIAIIVAAYGISLIQINDNPTRWFKPSHPIREADTVLNEHFGGTYMAYLSLQPAGAIIATAGVSEDAAFLPTLLPGDDDPEPAPVQDEEPSLPMGLSRLLDSIEPSALAQEPALPSGLGEGEPEETAEPALPAGLDGAVEDPVAAPEDAPEPAPARPEIFKDPGVLRYVARLQDHLRETGVVGKSNSIADIVKTVHRELIDGSPEAFRIPDTPSAVAQVLMQYQSSHRPHDIWHFVTPDYTRTSIWVQLRSGDNRDMSRVAASVAEFVAENPLEFTVGSDNEPVELEHAWFGLTYINVVWQEKMVSGMLGAFLGSFLVVLLMMTVLFRSGLWGFLSMIPLTITIGLIYGVIGLVGKDYDMPVAILSSLTLGLAVDFAIHFLARSRTLYQEHGSWEKAHAHVFGEPARAITRNVVVIAVGFLPLLFAPLRPYVTVGMLIAAILFVSGIATLLLLPALVRLLEPLLFPKTRGTAVTCLCGTCIVSAVVFVLLVAVNVRQFFRVGWTHLSWVSAVAVIVLASACWLTSHRERCRVQLEQSKTERQ